MRLLSRSLSDMTVPEFMEVWLVMHLCQVGSLQVCPAAAADKVWSSHACMHMLQSAPLPAGHLVLLKAWGLCMLPQSQHMRA